MSLLVNLIGEKIRNLRKIKGITQEELGERAQLQHSYIGGVERGDRNISLETLEKIMTALDLSPSDWIHFGELEAKNEKLEKEKLLEIHKSLLKHREIEEIQLIHRLTKDILITYGNNY
ncbi:MAG: helix-turn-helix transcriptional regulator [Paenibacillaceae bacterium]